MVRRWKRLTIVALVALVAAVTLPSIRRQQVTYAVEVPPPGDPIYLQTNGPTSSIGRGDWYTSDANGATTGYHYFTINVPCGWPSDTAVNVDLFSPEMNSTVPLADEDDDATPTNTSFEMYALGTAIGPAPDQPAAGSGIAGSLRTYAPSGSAESWSRFYTLAAPVACGTYVLRSEAGGDDQNSFRLRVGRDNDTDANNTPPANYDNPDGLPGTNDELVVGQVQAAYQHDAGATTCFTLYEYVATTQTQVPFHNFDMDDNGTVTYISPSGGQTAGTVSSNASWSTGSQTSRGTGDVIDNPETGWWQIQTCISNHNQFIQEGQTGAPGYHTQPPTPRMEVAKTDGLTSVLAGQTLTYTLSFTNTSDSTNAPGAANNVVLRDELPTGTTFVSCGFDAPYSGTCSQTSPGIVTFNLDGWVSAGANGSVGVTAQVNAGVSGQLTNMVTLDYTDQLDNAFPQVDATDIDGASIPTASATTTSTITSTSTSTATNAPTSSPTNTVINTATSTATDADTATSTPASTNSPTETVTNTETGTSIPTETHTATYTAIATSTSTAAPTDTATLTPTGTTAGTNTPTSTYTSTSTQTATTTATNIATGTATHTPISTSTSIPTDTSTATEIPANTATSTPTPTASPTATSTDEPTGTAISTNTRVASNTPTRTVTLTEEPTDTATNTATYTQAPTNTTTATDTVTASASSTPLPGLFGDLVWKDLDVDGVQDLGEPGIQGVGVGLYNAQGTAIATATTDGNGTYNFPGIVAGDYYLEFVPPAGYLFSPQDQGNDALDSDVDPATGRTDNITLLAGQHNLTVDAGLYQPSAPTSTPAKTATSTATSANAPTSTRTPGGPAPTNTPLPSTNTAVPGITNTAGPSATNTSTPRATGTPVVGATNTQVPRSTETRSPKPTRKPNYTDTPEPAATNTPLPLTFTSTDTPTPTATGTPTQVPPAWFGDLVWQDQDADGIQEPGEGGVPGVTVLLYNDQGELVASTTTNGSGNYQFEAPATGSYWVQFMAPLDYLFSPRDQGGSDDTDSDADPLTGRTAAVAALAGQTNLTLDAGLYQPQLPTGTGQPSSPTSTPETPSTGTPAPVESNTPTHVGTETSVATETPSAQDTSTITSGQRETPVSGEISPPTTEVAGTQVPVASEVTAAPTGVLASPGPGGDTLSETGSTSGEDVPRVLPQTGATPYEVFSWGAGAFAVLVSVFLGMRLMRRRVEYNLYTDWDRTKSFRDYFE